MRRAFRLGCMAAALAATSMVSAAPTPGSAAGVAAGRAPAPASVAAPVAVSAAASAAAPQAAASDELTIDFIDVEGGQATLIVSGGESLLIDAGFPGNDDRDANRIVAAAKARGLSQIDYMLVTHYHSDHVGGVAPLAAKFPIRTFVDHGPSVEKGEREEARFAGYLAVRGKGKHLQVKPGDRVPIKGLDVFVVSSGGEAIKTAAPGAGAAAAAANPLCAAFTPKEPDPSENAASVGVLIGFGRFRMVDLGDLTWNKEKALVCPNNLLGTVDLYLTTHHGMDISGPPVIVHALRPRVAVMNNGAKKGGSAAAARVVRGSPGLEDLWQVHYAVDSSAEDNVAEPLIANMDETTGHGIAVSARRDGGFTVTNARNGQTKSYAPRTP